MLFDEQHPPEVPPAAAQIHDRLLDLRDDGRLDTLGRFVQDEHPRPGDQGPGDGELLALSTGEQARAAVEQRNQRGGNRSSISAISALPFLRPSATTCRFSAQVSCPKDC